jgi:hypothetical protein
MDGVPAFRRMRRATRGTLWGAQRRSCSWPVLVEQTAEQIASTNLARLILADNRQPSRSVGCRKPERSMRTMPLSCSTYLSRQEDPARLLRRWHPNPVHPYPRAINRIESAGHGLRTVAVQSSQQLRWPLPSGVSLDIGGVAGSAWHQQLHRGHLLPHRRWCPAGPTDQATLNDVLTATVRGAGKAPRQCYQRALLHQGKPSLAGPPILIPRGGPRPCGSHQQSRSQRCATAVFPGRA